MSENGNCITIVISDKGKEVAITFGMTFIILKVVSF